MPVDRTLAEGLALALVELYGEVEQKLVADLARRLKAGIDRPDWAADKLGSVNDLRNAVMRMLMQLQEDTTGRVEQAIALAYARGGVAALDELVRLGGLDARQANAIRASLPGAEAVQRLVFALVSTLLGTHVRILRWGLDVYREVVASTVATGVLQGTESRIRTAQRTLDRLLARGVTGFVDKAGKRWDLVSYVEMATRTTTAQAAVQGHLDRLADRGIDLVIVSNAPQECKLCRPWEGKVLARDGHDVGGPVTIQREHAIRDREMVRVEVAGSVVEAVAAGFMHPNCRHSLSAYLPGVTKAPMNTEDPDGDEARQTLRSLERKVRKEKRQAAGSIEPAAKAFHERKAREYQAQIREHLKTAPTTLFRHPEREQIGGTAR
ncbi:hypothetical protein SUDANB95_05510 [Actinosynnema sp. ALI-1.44]